MRACAHARTLAGLLLSALLGTVAVAEPAAKTFDSHHHFVVVTFSNDPYRPVAPAGTTGRRYTGGSYGLAQSAHEQAKRVAAAYSLREVASWPIKLLAVHCVVYEIPDARSVDEVVSALGKDPRVTLAQPLQEFKTLTAPETYNDPLYRLQSNLVSLDISAAHERSQGAGVRVALVDTGVDVRHPDLHDRIAATRSFIDANPAGAAAYRHGTAMAGLIAAVANNGVGMVGIAPLARIDVFEACWQLKPNSDEAACNTFTLAQAIAAAVDSRAPIVNLSVAGPSDPLLGALVRNGLKRGVIFVGASADEPNSFPANIEGVIAVGSSENARAGTPVNAPGSHVLTLRPDGEYDFESGTSVAAAEVSGIVALMLSADSRLGRDAIFSMLSGPSSVDAGAALARVEAEKSRDHLAKAR